MARAASNGFIDGGLTAISGSDTLTVCAGQPTSIIDIGNRRLAEGPITGGDFTLGPGNPTGREVAIAQQVDLPITGAGTQTADHVVIDDGVDYYITTATPQELTNGGTVTVNGWKITIGAPTA